MDKGKAAKWLGHILRMGPERSLKRAVFVMFKSPREGDLMMDSPRHDSWRELTTYAADREWWRARVRAIRQQSLVRVEMGSHMVEGADRLPFTVS